jgi:DNA polymerase-3 subunit epsilon
MISLKSKPRAVIDLETTGLNPLIQEVIEVGILKDSKVNEWDSPTEKGLDCLNLKIRPSRIDQADPKALQVNGYKAENWKDAISFQEAALRINEFLKGCVIFGYNVKFDMGFLEALFKEAGVKPSWGYHHIDVLALAYEQLAPCGLEQLSLKAVCEFLGIPPEPDVHRAINGAQRCLQVLEKLQRASWLDRLWWKLRNAKRMRAVRKELVRKEQERKNGNP